MGFWNDVQAKVQSALDIVQKNPILDAFATSALESIPVIGGLLVKMYDNSKDSPEDKTDQLVQLLQKMQNMTDNQLENFCRGLEQNKELILENQNYLKQISQDTSVILSKLDEAKKERRTIVKDVQRVENKIDKLYKIIEQSKLHVLEKYDEQEFVEKPNSFSGPDFRISWPDGWKKLDEKEILEGIKGMDTSTVEKYDIEQVGKEALVLRKETGEKRRPNINLVKDEPISDISKFLDFQSQLYEDEFKWKVVKTNHDKTMGIGTLEAKLNPFGLSAFMIQKFYFRKNYTLIVTITQLTQDQLEADPNYATEVREILQSLVFLT